MNIINLAKYSGVEECLDHLYISFDLLTQRISVYNVHDIIIDPYHDLLVYEYNDPDNYLLPQDILSEFKTYQHACSDIIETFKNNDTNYQMWYDICDRIMASLTPYGGVNIHTFVREHISAPIEYKHSPCFYVHDGCLTDYVIDLTFNYGQIYDIAESVFDTLYETYVLHFDHDDIMEELLIEYKRMYYEINGCELPKDFFE